MVYYTDKNGKLYYNESEIKPSSLFERITVIESSNNSHNSVNAQNKSVKKEV